MNVWYVKFQSENWSVRENVFRKYLTENNYSGKVVQSIIKYIDKQKNFFFHFHLQFRKFICVIRKKNLIFSYDLCFIVTMIVLGFLIKNCNSITWCLCWTTYYVRSVFELCFFAHLAILSEIFSPNAYYLGLLHYTNSTFPPNIHYFLFCCTVSDKLYMDRYN